MRLVVHGMQAYYVWDATRFAADALMNAYHNCNNGRNGTCVQEYMRNGTLAAGATGDNIRLDDKGDRAGSYSVVNYQSSSSSLFVPVGTVFVASNDTAAADITASAVQWAGGGTTVPGHGDFSVDEDDQNVGGIVAGLVVVFLVLWIVWFVVYRRKMRAKVTDCTYAPMRTTQCCPRCQHLCSCFSTASQALTFLLLPLFPRSCMRGRPSQSSGVFVKPHNTGPHLTQCLTTTNTGLAVCGCGRK